MDRRIVAVDTDLYPPHATALQHLSAFGSDKQRVRFQTYIEVQAPRGRKNFLEILAKKNLTPAESKEQRSAPRQLLQDVDALAGRQLAAIFMIEIAVNTTLVAAIGQIEMHTERYTTANGSRNQAVHQRRRSELEGVTQRASFPDGVSADKSSLRVESSSNKE